MQLWGEILLLLLIASIASHSHGVGVNWGTQSNYQLDPKVVVKLLQKNNIRQLKLFDSEPKTLKSLVGSGIEVMVAIPNVDLLRMSDPSLAKTWFETHILPFCYHGGVNITYVAVGNEPFLTGYNGSFINTTYPALQNVQNALNEAKLGDKIKATVPLNADVLTSTNMLPSGGVFRDDIKDLMTDIVAFLNKNGAPVTINIYPFLSLYVDASFPKEYAFFDGGDPPLQDGTATYTSSFIASFDTLVAALKKIGFPDEEIIIGEVGWPTDGDSDATIGNAKRFNQGFLDYMQKNLGTPLRPNKEIKYYLFGLLDEEAKSVAPGNFERHWGIFKYNGEVKYPLRLPSIDNATSTSLVGAKNVAYLKKEWCVFNTSATDTSKLGDSITYACTYADCTPLGYGCSCNLVLDANGNASYAFNQYYQVQGQRFDACNFNGLAQLTTIDPSINATLGTCIFPLALDASSTGSSFSPPLPCNSLKIWHRMTLVGFFLLLMC